MNQAVVLMLAGTLAFIGQAQPQQVTCQRTYKKVGCIKTGLSSLTDLLITDRDATSEKYQGILLNWKTFGDSIHSLACRCAAKAANGGYKMFSIRFFAECYGTKEDINLATAAISNDCIGPSFQQCIHSHSEECVGKAFSEYLYQTVAAIPTEQPSTDGGYSDWTDWGPCTASCGDKGEQSRERVCNKPPPSGPKGKDCSSFGASTELRPCNRFACGYQCPEMLGDYPHAILAATNGLPTGKWTSGPRPDFKGAFTGPCKGEMTFPDDRKYTFEFDKLLCRIVWDGDRNHFWQRNLCETGYQCPDILGDYPHATISATNGYPSGKWLSGPRPVFKGLFTGQCKGEMTFPDDRRYTFEYDRTTCRIVWDGDRNHFWQRNVCSTGYQCPEMLGEYPHAMLSTASGYPSGKWTSGPRPAFKGVFLGDCKGEMTFPDDRKYAFAYDKTTCRITWDNDRNHIWQKNTCFTDSQCPEMFGDYSHAVLSAKNGYPSGRWTSGPRPEFNGVFTSICKGEIIFPDDRKYTFEYDRAGCRIVWDGDTNHFWRKARC